MAASSSLIPSSGAVAGGRAASSSLIASSGVGTGAGAGALLDLFLDFFLCLLVAVEIRRFLSNVNF